MDLPLTGTVILGAFMLPYTVEVIWQFRLQTRFLADLPASARAALPRHPRRPWLAAAGSVRFFLALWRYVRRDLPDDPAAILALKRKMRASVRREIVWACGALATLVVLVVVGWRPIWP